MAVVARVSVVPSPQLTVSDVTVVLLVTVNVAVTCWPTNAVLGDRVGPVMDGTPPAVTVIVNAVLVLPAWAVSVVAGEYVPTTLKVPVIEEVNVAVHVAVPTGLVP